MGTTLEEVNTMSEDELKSFCQKASDKDLESMFPCLHPPLKSG